MFAQAYAESLEPFDVLARVTLTILDLLARLRSRVTMRRPSGIPVTRAHEEEQPMTSRFHNPPGVWQPFGNFSMVALQGAGQIVHLKGQVALDADGEVVGEGDMPVQVDQCLQNVARVLETLGGEMADVFSATHYTTDIAAFMTCGEVRGRYFSPPYPVTTTVEVAKLYRPELLIEITCAAEIPRERFVAPTA